MNKKINSILSKKNIVNNIEKQSDTNKLSKTKSKERNVEKEMDKLLLSEYVPASVLINDDLQIIRFHGPVSRYLQPVYDKANPQLLNVVRDEFISELKALIYKAKNDKLPAIKKGIPLLNKDEESEVTLEAVPLSPGFFLILFKESTIIPEIQNTIIKENEERFRALIQNSFDIITVFNSYGIITYQSDSIERVLGYKAQDRLHTNIFEKSIVLPEDREIEKKLFQKCTDNPNQYITGEFRMMHTNGSIRVMEVGCINLLNNSSIKGIIKNYRDVTERRTIEKQKEEFIGVASHELKTPVTSIKAYTQILHETLLEKKDVASAALLLRMDHQIDRLTSLIKDLLDVTKITEGKLELKEERFNMNDLVKEITDEMQVTVKNHRIIRELNDLQPIIGDRERISQVLINLISNAVKYSPNSEEVIIKTSMANGELMVCVQDFGIGISENMQKKIFQRFFRVVDDSNRTFPGLGLGLFISAEIIKRQNGRMWVESALNKGSCFCFTLPYQK